jgi:hypothetical protein
MKKSSIGHFLLYGVVCAGIALSSINCAGPGSMYGSVSANISDQPGWGPIGYDRADYYYLPEINSYYSVSDRQYYYRDGTNWTHASSLPTSYRSHDLYHSYKVVVNEDRPYQNNIVHQEKYRAYRDRRDQPVIRDSHDPKYYENKDHPEHDNWVKKHNH